VDTLFFCEEFPHNERGVCRRIVMVQQPVSVLPHLRPFAPHILPQSSQNLAVKLPIDSLTRWNFVDSLSSRITSRIFAIISGDVHVDGRPECLSSSTDSRPPLKGLNHSNVLAWLKDCSPKASFRIRWVSAAVLLSLKQNLMQVLCSLTPAISINATTLDNCAKKTAKIQKHVHLQKSQLPDCWSKDTK